MQAPFEGGLYMQVSMHIKTTLGTSKMWSLYTGENYMQAPIEYGLYMQVSLYS